MFEDVLNINNDFYGIMKIVVASIGFISIIIKLQDFFSDVRRRQNLKLDLEILELAKRSNSSETKHVSQTVEKEMAQIYDSESFVRKNSFDYLIGLFLFIGFGYWTIDIFNSNDKFNPWTLLTMFLSLSGLITLFNRDSTKNYKGEFLRIEFHDRSNYWLSSIIGFISSFTLIYLVIQDQKMSIWSTVAGLFSIFFLSILYKSTRIIKTVKRNKSKNA